MIGWLDIPQVCKLIACCAAADDVDGDGDDDCRISVEQKSESTGWHCLLVTHWLVWLSKKHKRGKVAKSAFKSSFQWVVRLLTIITGEKGRTRFKIRREEKSQIKSAVLLAPKKKSNYFRRWVVAMFMR